MLGSEVELLVGQVGSLSQLLGLGLHELFVTVSEAQEEDNSTLTLMVSKFSKSTNGLSKNFVVIVEKSFDVFPRNIVKFKT